MTEEKKIGRYVVQARLGEGAMGNVFKAHDPFIKRTVAIKTVKMDPSRNEGEAREFYERFILEAQISGNLSHPNIVAIFDVGDQDGIPYIAMEFVEGNTLDVFVRGQPRPSPAELVKILIQVAGALDFAHSKGIVHRDLKPSNIMVLAEGTAKIMDFGIAKMTGANLTQTGVFLGTPSFSSPEQIKEGHVDHRSDIFTFGILAHEILTGHLPFGGKSINAILYKIANEPPKHAPNLNDLPIDAIQWRKVMDRVLDKNPDRRYQRASDFTNELVQCFHFSDRDQRKLGTFRTELNATVLSVSGIQKELRRSEFEKTMGAQKTVHVVSARRKPRWRPLPVLSILLLLAIGGGVGWLWYRDELTPLVRSVQARLGLDLAKDEAGPDMTPLGSPPKFAVHSEPSGAAVFLDNVSLGMTPLEVAWPKEKKKALELRVALEGYQVASQLLKSPGDLNDRYDFQLRALPVKRTILSEPSGARVTVDGADRGTSPVELEMEPGKAYNILVEKMGFSAQSRKYEEGTSGQDVLRFDLKPVAPPGKVAVTSLMEDLQVYVNGRRQKTADLSLEAGDYQIRLKSPAYFYDETLNRVNVLSNQTETLTTPPIINIDKLDFIGGYVKVRINGQYVKNGGEIDTTPLVDLKIAAGTHKFEFIDQNDNIVAQRTIEVNRSESITVTADD